MTNIPAARQAILRIAAEIEDEGLTHQADQLRAITKEPMTRRPGRRRAPSTRTHVDSDIRKKVIHDLNNTDLPQEEIARKYNIDGGRVSEIYKSIRD